MVLATADAKFAMSETGLGIPPAQIAPFVAARVGVARTRRLALTGYRFDGREAERIGLVDVACADAAALEAALAQVLAEIGRCAPGANAAIKRLLLASRTMPRDQLLDESADAFAACLRGPEGQEGVTAFLEKRKPNWIDLTSRSFPRKRNQSRTRTTKTRNAMSLAGQAVVAIWNGIAPEGRTEFYEWHNREHMPERVGIPGFRRGRRYIAKYGTPEYFTLYEADSRRSAGGAGLSQPAEQSDAVDAARSADLLPRYARGICRVKLSLGVGQGGCMLTLRFGAEDGREAELEQHLRHTALPPLADIVLVSGVHLCIADQAGSGIKTAEKRRPQGRRHPELADHDRGAACRKPPTRRATSCSAAISRARREARDGARALSAAVLPDEDAGVGVAQLP